MKKLFLLITIIFAAVTVNAQLYSFEEVVVPSQWSVSKGLLSVTAQKYKLGSHSLCWDWQAGGELTAIAPTGLAAASTASAGGLTAWIYNAQPTTQALTFSFRNSLNVELCKINFNLNFKGWRMLQAAFNADMHHNATSLNRMVIEAPITGSGQLYFDYIEFVTKVSWERMSDFQQQVTQSEGNIDKFLDAYNRSFPALVPTQAQILGLQTIRNRTDEWLLWNGTEYATDPSFIKRKAAVNTWINRAKKDFPSLGLVIGSDGTVTGKGLYGQTSPATATDGSPLEKFQNVGYAFLIPFAIDYRKNGTQASRNAALQIYDYFYDQGWAAGSGLGTLRFEKLRSAAYFNSVYLLRDALGDERLARETEAMKWFSLIGYTTKPYFGEGETADNFRALGVAKLFYVLMLKDQAKAASILKEMSAYFDHFFSPSVGYLGILKPDYSGYHHRASYFGAYYPQALYIISLMDYLFKDTPYALSAVTEQHIKKALLRFADVAACYNIPTATNGRFPKNTDILDFLLPSYAYLSIAMGGDAELDAVLKRRWDPNNPLIDNLLGKASTEITHTQTMGAVALTLRAFESISPSLEKQEPTVSFFMPYSGLAISRSPQNQVSIKGFSKYIWDYESSPTENLYGRYLSYGQIEYTDLITGRKNNAFDNPLWNWNKIPGTTVKVLSEKALNYNKGGNKRDRNFSDQSFLGGVALNDSTILTSFSLHDITFDQSFCANKSVVIRGNTLLCVGSNINLTGTTTPVVTTLFQQQVLDNEQIMLNGAPVIANTVSISKPTLVDNLSIAYIVKEGNVEVVKDQNLISATLRHGFGPVHAGYQYYMIPHASSAQIAACEGVDTAPFEVLCANNLAHIVKIKADNSQAFSVFDISAPFYYPTLISINSPSLFWIQPLVNGHKVVVSDPDMRRGTATNMTALTDAAVKQPSQPFEYKMVFKGVYDLKTTHPNITITATATTTTVTIWVVDAQSYSFSLVTPGTATRGAGMMGDHFSCYYIPVSKQCILAGKESLPFSCDITTLDGRKVESLRALTTSFTLDLSNFKPACYLVTLYDSNNTTRYKLLIH